MFENIKYPTSLLLSYLFICSIGWNVSYWHTFNINPFEYFEISDVLKSFIFPLILSVLGSMLYFLLFPILTLFIDKKSNSSLINTFIDDTSNKYQNIKSVIYILIYFALFLSIYFFVRSTDDQRFVWFPFSLSSCFIVLLIITKSELIDKYINRKFRLAFIGFSLLTPAVTISTAKIEALEILYNVKYSYVNIKESDSLSVKYKVLGKLGDFIVLRNTGNNYNKIIKIDDIKDLKLYFYNAYEASKKQ